MILTKSIKESLLNILLDTSKSPTEVNCSPPCAYDKTSNIDGDRKLIISLHKINIYCMIRMHDVILSFHGCNYLNLLII